MVPVVFVLSETLGTNPLYLALGNKKICYMKKHTFFISDLQELPSLPAMPSCCLWAPPTMPLSMMLERYIMTKDIRDNVMIYFFRKELTWKSFTCQVWDWYLGLSFFWQPSCLFTPGQVISEYLTILLIFKFFLNQGPSWVLTLFLPGPTPPWTPSPVSVQWSWHRYWTTQLNLKMIHC